MLYFAIANTIQRANATSEGKGKGNTSTLVIEVILERILKTLIFIDGRKLVQKLIDTIRGQLVELTKYLLIKKRYIQYSRNSSIDVRDVVQLYTSNIAKHNQIVRYEELYKLGTTSVLRILITTTAISTGINILDIIRVIQQKFPIGKDIKDKQQRFSRLIRLLELYSNTFFFK